MKFQLFSVYVDDQDKALKFYTEILGFVKKIDMPAGEFKFLTVAQAHDPDGVELLLEPNDNPIAQTYQQALRKENLPVTVFGVDNVQEEYERLKGLGVTFTQEPTEMGPITVAVFDDTCGNLIQIAQSS
ncbi:VOC family protein [Phototrophicus methaneseepsis]|uniref:VOC family protein n=1 Tax=Phototrophicus methaneseepsis TaxID=2710758 RepID=A0A7S8EBI7_9CHLR|nr:VOC family protein [Phototrophicus methaneseepsis]QPC83916.1 VOC family protein [Phototrophicus methaneseepsis]